MTCWLTASSHYPNQHWPFTNMILKDIFNSLAPEWCGSNFKSVISKHMLRIKFMSTSCQIDLRWIPQNTFDDKSTLIQVMKKKIIMAWWRQTTSHYLSQYWPKSLSPYGVTGPQWVIFIIHHIDLVFPGYSSPRDRKGNCWFVLRNCWNSSHG